MTHRTFQWDVSATRVADMVSEPARLGDEFYRQAVDFLHTQIEAQLREKGPGWCLGYRLKDNLPPFGRWSREADKVTIEWEFHLVELVNGEVPWGHDDMTYVQLKDLDHDRA